MKELNVGLAKSREMLLKEVSVYPRFIRVYHTSSGKIREYGWKSIYNFKYKSLMPRPWPEIPHISIRPIDLFITHDSKWHQVSLVNWWAIKDGKDRDRQISYQFPINYFCASFNLQPSHFPLLLKCVKILKHHYLIYLFLNILICNQS